MEDSRNPTRSSVNRRKTVTIHFSILPRGMRVFFVSARRGLAQGANILEKKVLLSLPKSLARRLYFLRPKRRKHPMLTRLGWASMAALMFFGANYQLFETMGREIVYAISPSAEALLDQPSEIYAQSLKLNASQRSYLYNEGFRAGSEVISQGGPKFSASFSLDPKQGVTLSDPGTGATVTFIPEFGLHEPRQDENRLVYPVVGNTAQKVFTVRSTSIKEDIVLNQFSKDSMEFRYLSLIHI